MYENGSHTLVEGRFTHPRLEYNQLSVHIPCLRKPARLLHVSDLHFGLYGLHSWIPTKTQQEIAEHIVNIANDPDEYFDALIFTGDAKTHIKEFTPLSSKFSTEMRTLEKAMEPFKDIEIPMVACPANHDVPSGQVHDILTNVGFQMLDPNQKEPVITSIGEQLSVWSLPDLDTQKDELTAMCERIHDFKDHINPDSIPVILAHHPDSFDYLPQDFFYFGMAGHTHGGVYRDPILKTLALMKLGLINMNYH